MIHYVTPYRSDKDLGRAYNDAFKYVGEDDWICLRDIDTLFLTPDAPKIIEHYVNHYPDTGIFTCYTNRISLSSKHQLALRDIDDRSDVKIHIKIAETLANGAVIKGHTYTELESIISGFLMVISKRTWNEHKFSEGGKCLGVDNEYSERILKSGKTIIRMNALYVWHTYRLIQGVHNKKHLQ